MPSYRAQLHLIRRAFEVAAGAGNLFRRTL